MACLLRFALEKRKLKYGDIIIEKSGGSSTQAVGRVVFFDKKSVKNYLYSNFTSRIRVINERLDSLYLCIYLNFLYESGYTFSFQTGTSGIKNLNLNNYMLTKIPLPPMEIQQKIVAECETVDKEVAQAKQGIIEARKLIENEINNVFNKTEYTW